MNMNINEKIQKLFENSNVKYIGEDLFGAWQKGNLSPMVNTIQFFPLDVQKALAYCEIRETLYAFYPPEKLCRLYNATHKEQKDILDFCFLEESERLKILLQIEKLVDNNKIIDPSFLC